MELTAAALSLNTIFAGYDEALLGLMHRLAGSAGGVLTPLCKLITLLPKPAGRACACSAPSAAAR